MLTVRGGGVGYARSGRMKYVRGLVSLGEDAAAESERVQELA